MADTSIARAPARELSSINFQAMLGGPLVAVIQAQSQAAMSSVNFIKAVGFKPPPENQDTTTPGTGEPIYVSFKYPKEVAPFQPAVPASFTLKIDNPGTGYTDGELALTFSGGDGTGAAGKATANGGKITAVTLTSPGTGYTSAPTVSITAGGGTGGAISADFQRAQAATPAQFVDMKLEVPILTMLPIPFIRIEETTIDFNAKINSVEETKTDETVKVDASLSAKVQYPPAFSIATVNLKVNTSYQKNTQSGAKVDRTYSMAVHIRAVQDEMPAGMEKLLGILEDSIRSRPLTT